MARKVGEDGRKHSGGRRGGEGGSWEGEGSGTEMIGRNRRNKKKEKQCLGEVKEG